MIRVKYFTTSIIRIFMVTALAGSLASSMTFAETLTEQPDKACEVALTEGSVGSSPTQLDEAEIEKNVQIIWYPKSSYFVISHMEMIIDDVLWSATAGYSTKGNSITRERAANIGGNGYLAFHLKVTDSEFRRISQYLEENKGKIKIQTCTSGACRAITKNSGVVIPFPFSQVPTLAATYLAIASKLGYKRVSKIEWVGQRNFKQFMAVQPFYEAWATYYLGNEAMGLLVTGIDQTQKIIQNFIPVLSNLGLGKRDQIEVIPFGQEFGIGRMCVAKL